MVGHYLGLWNGLGGTCTTTRMADEAIKSGKVVIQNTSEFMTWTQSPTCSMWNVKFMFVPKEVCESTEKELEMLPFKAVNRATETILLREGSYCCNNSISERPYEFWWVDMTSVEKNVLVKFGGDKYSYDYNAV